MKFKKAKGFTLIEILIYSGILVVSAGLVSGIVYTISRANIKIQVNDILNNQFNRFEEIFRQKIQVAKGINSISGSLLSLEMSDSNKNPTIFTLTDNTLYIQEGASSGITLNDSDKVKVTSLDFASTGSQITSISNTYHYAWNDQIGWIDFAYTGGNLQVPTGVGDLSGLAYVIGDSHWISLNCLSTESCTTVDYKVSSDINGNLTGWAWSENFGWISFNCLTDNTCSFSDYKVTIDQDTGEFDGYAYSENIGWISFNCKTGGVGQSDICSTSDYKVQDVRSITNAIKIDISIQYNSEKLELSATNTRSFVFNLVTPTK